MNALQPTTHFPSLSKSVTSSGVTASILVASRAEGNWKHAIEALENQTFPHVQIVVVIDRVSCLEERRKWQQEFPAIDFVYNDQNIGLTKSLNRGLEICNGNVVFRCDDDDVSAPDRIQKQMDYLLDHKLDLVFGVAEGMSDPERAAWEIRPPQTDSEIKKALLKRNVLVHSTLGIRRDCLTALGGYTPQLKYAQDYDLYLRAMRHGLRFGCVPEVILRRFYTKNTITVAQRKTQIMYSMIGRLLHAADQRNIKDFLSVIPRYIVLLVTPNRLREIRRRLFAVSRRGL